MIAVRVGGRELAERPAAEELRSHLREGLAWVDARDCDAEDVAWLAAALHLHPLEVEDIVNRNQRPKVDEYPDHLFVVLIGVVHSETGAELRLVETHVLVGEGWVATISDGEVPALRELAARVAQRPELCQGESGRLFYRICDAAVDSYFPLLDELDAQIDALETGIVSQPDRRTVSEIFGLKRDLGVLRRVIGPQRDLLQGLAGPHGPRLGGEAQLYLRDVYDHAVRITEQVDAYRDIVTGALDVYLSSVNNRLTEQTRRLALVATIFLPLTFFTGFFGQNFAVLVGFISSAWVFWVALGLMAVSVVLIYVVSQRLSRSATPLPEVSARRRLMTRRSGLRRPGAAAPAPAAPLDPGTPPVPPPETARSQPSR